MPALTSRSSSALTAIAIDGPGSGSLSLRSLNISMIANGEDDVDVWKGKTEKNRFVLHCGRLPFGFQRTIQFLLLIFGAGLHNASQIIWTQTLSENDLCSSNSISKTGFL